ncbi:MAG: hypothetical protein COB22_06005 [Cycloclasticus sp.]|nr:MAG: hypothetical protein COB22_06005 [Cycloclasticus sp.]
MNGKRINKNAGLRMPKHMLEMLDIEARKNCRSRNSEMIVRLRDSMANDGVTEKAPSVVNG